jgi:hypothetical protein
MVTTSVQYHYKTMQPSSVLNSDTNLQERIMYKWVLCNSVSYDKANVTTSAHSTYGLENIKIASWSKTNDLLQLPNQL